jgi:Na+/H+ antiporter NhaD/arsenite permease-like protein
MTPAYWSILALIVAIAISCVTEWNIGVLAAVLAWAVGTGFGGMKPAEVMAGFPTVLFLTLAGTTLLFSQVEANGTLHRMASRVSWLCRGNVGLFPIAFFIFAVLISTSGTGNISTMVVLAPMAMAVAGRTGIPPILMAIMTANGVNAGNLSPFTPTGIVVKDALAKAGITGVEWQTWAVMLGLQALVAAGAFLLFGGLKLLKQHDAEHDAIGAEAFEAKHWITLAVVGVWMASVMFLSAPVGLSAFAASIALTAFGLADHKDPIKRMPWAVIIMICGVTLLITVLDKTQGMELFTDWIARISTPGTVNGVVAFITGLVSSYSSTSGVVIPTFVPIASGLAARLGIDNPLPIAWAISFGAHVVDVSPLSTLGALSLAAAPEGTNTRRMFNQLMAWGFSMAPVSAVLCWLLL